MKLLGNEDLMNYARIGLFASREIATISVLPLLDWTCTIAKQKDIAVVSGFHSKLEREVLEFLVNGQVNIICVLARGIYKNVPERFRKAYEEGRVLFISLCNDDIVRSSRYECQRRNKYIADFCDRLVFSSVNEGSSLQSLYARFDYKSEMI